MDHVLDAVEYYKQSPPKATDSALIIIDDYGSYDWCTPEEYCEGAKRIDPKRSLIPKKVCPICGETDDKYPEWDEDCGHEF